VGEWVLRNVVPDRARMHLAADLLRLGQRGPIAAFMRSPAAARLLPAFARQGWAMTPAIETRAGRALERVAPALPPGARLEERADGLVFLPAGPARARVGFFTTCVMETMFPAINREAVRLLVLAGCEVAVPAAQTCCGAALREAGELLHDDEAAASAARFAGRVRDVAEVLAELGLPEPTVPLHAAADAARPLRIGYHDPCHLAHAQKVRAAPRRLLRSLPGVELVDLPNADWCCGSAGVYNLTHPEMAETQLKQKLDSIEQVAPELVVASNPGCLLHMERGARARGLGVRMVHLVEVLGRAYPASSASASSAG
jgi:glycolate oxidase iron-sulfur subunit